MILFVVMWVHAVSPTPPVKADAKLRSWWGWMGSLTVRRGVRIVGCGAAGRREKYDQNNL